MTRYMLVWSTQARIRFKRICQYSHYRINDNSVRPNLPLTSPVSFSFRLTNKTIITTLQHYVNSLSAKPSSINSGAVR